MTDESLGFEVIGRYEGEARLRALAEDIDRIRIATEKATQAARAARLNVRRAQLNIGGLSEKSRAQLIKNEKIRALENDQAKATLREQERNARNEYKSVADRYKALNDLGKNFTRNRAEQNAARVRLAREIAASEEALAKRSFRAIQNAQNEISKGLTQEQRARAEQNQARVRLAKEIAASEAVLERKSFKAIESSQRDIQRGIDERRRETERVAKAEERAARNQNHISEVARRWLFTLRRVVLVYGAIRAAQLTITGLSTALVESLKFGNELERAPKAIAGITAATFDVRDAMGNLLSPTEAYTAALGEARKQLKGLTADAIGSASTFEELQENFLTAIGPGSIAGFSLDEIRRFTVTISEIAAVTGQAQNQLAEEIRALFTGDIRAKDSRIARNLGISAADIKRVREAGTQVQFLDAKFAAFKESTKELQNTLPRVLSDLKDGARLAAAEGMEPLRLTLAEIGKEIRDLAIKKVDGQVIIDPRFAAAIKPIAEALSTFARNTRVAAAEVGILATQVVRLGSELLAFFSTLAPFFSGFASVFSALFGIVSGVLKQLGALTGSVPEFIGKMAGMTAALTVLVTVLGYFPAAFRAFSAALVLNGRLLAGWTSTSIVATRTQRGLYGALLLTRRALVLLSRFILKPLLIIGALGQATQLLITKFEGFRTVANEFERGLRNIFGNLSGGETKRLEDSQLLTNAEKPFDEAFKKILDSISSGTDKVSNALGLAGDDLEGASFNARIEDILAFDDVEQGFKDSLSLQDVRLDFAAAADAAGEFAEVLSLQLQLAEDEALALQEVNREMAQREKQQAKLDLTTEEGRARANVLAAELKTLEADKVSVAALYADELKRQVAVLEQRNRLTAEFAISEAKVQAQLSASQAKLSDKNVFRDELSEYFEQLARLADARLQVEKIQAAIDEAAKASTVVRGKLSAGQSTVKPGETLIVTANAEADIRERVGRLNAIELQTAKNIVKVEKQKLEELEKQFSARKGIDDAIKDQIRDLTAASNFGRFVTDASNSLRNGLSTAILDAFDPRTLEAVNFSIVGQNIALDFVRSLAQAGLDQFLFKPLFNAIGGALGLITTDPAQAAHTLALTTHNSGMLAHILGMQAHAAALTAFGFSGAISLGSASDPGFISDSFGGRALGGPVDGPMLASAPPGFDPRDRIPILTRAGEYVATPEMDRAAPGLYQYLEALRRKTHGLGGVGKLPPMFAMRESFQPRGFATGGAVSVAATSSGSSRGGVTVLPVLVTGSREIDRIVASPSFARGAMLHRSTLRMINNPRPD